MPSVIVGDCLDVLPTLPLCKLAFADPPFNTGEEYANFVDKRDDYGQWTLQWIEALWAKCSGVMFLHGPFHVLELYLRAKDKFNLPYIASGVWMYNFGQYQRTNYVSDHCYWIAFGHKGHTWNPDAVQVPSTRLQMGDKRTEDSEYGGMRPPGRVWGIPSDGPFWGRVQGNNKERCEWSPNQLPIRYLQRVILGYTNPGDLVIDPFSGSGTTGLVAHQEGREYWGIEISEETASKSQDRILHGFYRSV